jgi:tetratricopeptide (TPR) repeat protein
VPNLPPRKQRLLDRLTHRYVVTAFLSSCLLGAMGHMSVGCSGWDPTRPFERQNPDVDRALEMIEDGEYENAQEVLTRFLDVKGDKTCKAGKIGLPDNLKSKSDGMFDLGLVLFHLAEKYGERFGDEPKLFLSPEGVLLDSNGAPAAPPSDDRINEVKCGLLVSLAIARDNSVALELRARAFYLAGNLHFLLGKYKLAMDAYGEALRLIPGIQEDAGESDAIGRDAAWNRAVALRRLEQELDAGGEDGEDAGEDGEGPEEPEPQNPADGGEDGDGSPDQPDGDEDGGGDGGDGGDAGDDAGDAGEKPGDAGEDGGEDAGDDGEPVDNAPDAGDKEPAEPDSNSPPIPIDPQPGEPDEKGPSSAEQGDKVLDKFDKAPSYQQEEAKKRNEGRKRTMEDK